MKLLWATNTVPPQLAAKLGRNTAGHWMWSLLEILRSQVESITVLTEQEGMDTVELVQGNVHAIVVGIPKPISKWLPSAKCSDAFIERASKVECDVMHIHGTEHSYAYSCRLAQPRKPLALSIQGLIGPYARYMQGTLRFPEALLIGGPIAAIRGTSPFGQKFAFHHAAVSERNNIAAADLIFCRTSWDAGHVRSIRPDARVHYGAEAIRPEFANSIWRKRETPTLEPRLLFTNGASPVKNVTEILEAVAILVRRGLSPQLRLAGFGSVRSGYVRHLIQRAKSLGILDRVVFLGYLDAGKIVEEMLAADVYISASLIDNSPNSVCEAQMVGVPVVASAVGGVIDLVQHGRTGFLYQNGEIPQLVECVVRLVTDPSRAATISSEAREAAIARHDVRAIKNQYLSAYKALLGHGAPPNEQGL
jgi:glycosyltransferase involved in cell wall biosynthesis